MSYIFSQLRKSEKYAEKEAGYAHTEVAVNDIVEAIVKQCGITRLEFRPSSSFYGWIELLKFGYNMYSLLC